MEKEKKKPPTGIFFTCTEAQKRKIKSIAEKCYLWQGEYILKRALCEKRRESHSYTEF
ncbi:MAG: hypothetical protein J5938_05230 [Clostridia bacterium]|nr:hypothetical protein [Clostridia bacterium]